MQIYDGEKISLLSSYHFLGCAHLSISNYLTNITALVKLLIFIHEDRYNSDLSDLSSLHRSFFTLVGNIHDMSAHVIATPTLSAKNQPMPNVANAVTGFKAGSHVSCCVDAQLPAISMTHGSITPMELRVVFK